MVVVTRKRIKETRQERTQAGYMSCFLRQYVINIEFKTQLHASLSQLYFFVLRDDGDLLDKAAFLFLGDAVSLWHVDDSTSLSFDSCFLAAFVK